MGCITNDISKDAMNIKRAIKLCLSEIVRYSDEIEEMESEKLERESELLSLEGELEQLEQNALDWDDPLEIYFDDLIENKLHTYDYVIERDPWVMKERWNIEDVHFCCLIFDRLTVYSCSDDFYPTKDSVMKLAGRM